MEGDSGARRLTASKRAVPSVATPPFLDGRKVRRRGPASSGASYDARASGFLRGKR